MGLIDDQKTIIDLVLIIAEHNAQIAELRAAVADLRLALEMSENEVEALRRAAK